MPTYDVPGVYIEEVTGPGVITGVSTSTAGFIGPALNGPIGVAQQITSYDDFLQQYGVLQPNDPNLPPAARGTYWPYITSPRWFYLAHGVRSFFQNGGALAYVLRVGTAKNTQWQVQNQKPEPVILLQAQTEGVVGDNITIQVADVNYTGAAGVAVANPTATVTSGGGTTQLTINPANAFLAGDNITDGTTTASVTNVQGSVITVSAPLAGPNLRIADITPGPGAITFRMANTTGLFAGTVVQITGFDPTPAVNKTVTPYVVIQSIDQAGFVTLAGTPALTNTLSMAGTAAQPVPVLVSQEFSLVITQPVPALAETWNYLSLNPLHPNYVFSAVQSAIVDVLPPVAPPTANTYPSLLVQASAALPITQHGAPDDPTLLTYVDYTNALNIMQDVENVNLLVIPDASTTDYQNIQNAMIDSCLLKRDRFAILDSRPGAQQLTGPGSIDEQRQNVEAEDGFAALYFPWLQVPDPTWQPSATNVIPATMLIPPSGAIAGVYANVDQSVGVHKAPANTPVLGVVGLERKLSDRQQGPLNLAGIDVLRIFPGSGQVTVWGARTTGDPNITDWIYVNVRRLMIYIEQSIEVGIRWAVFEPNALPLWQKLKRTITEFLTRVWRDGALVGATAAQAFYVRIDEALNPPSTQALGRLYIEIGVAPVRPAEFIIVRIGLWDGGTQVTES